MKNNLDLIRLFAAFLVMYSHSFKLMGKSEPVFLSWTILGPLGVYIFFTISGYLIARSWDSDPHLFRYFVRRSLRIFPALIVCTVLSILVLGPFVTTLSLDQYFYSPALRRYWLNIFLNISYYLPGVFEHNHVPSAVNGSLWSLPVEFFMYVVVAGIGLLFRNSRWAYLALSCVFSVGYLAWVYSGPEALLFYATDLRLVPMTGIYFVVGACLYKFGLQRFLSVSTVTTAFILLLCLEPWPMASTIASWLLLPWIVMGFGLSYSKTMGRLVKSGDYSYGVYIYAFPVQQIVAQFFPQVDMASYLVMTIVPTLALAILSWHFIERPMLALKPTRPGGVSDAEYDGMQGSVGWSRRMLLGLYRRLPPMGGTKAKLKSRILQWERYLRHSLESSQNERALAALLQHRSENPWTEFRLDRAKPPDIPLDITVVTYNSSKWLPGLLASLDRQSYPLRCIGLYFVDHGSSDDSLTLLSDLRSKYAERLRHFEIHSRPNLGFGTGHNFAIARGEADFVLVANPDIEFEGDTLTRVVTLAIADDARTASWELRQKPYEHPKHYDPVTWETNWSSHACILLRRSAWRAIGGYDEGMFLYAEDVEFSYRLRREGFRLRYCPNAVVWHYAYGYEREVKPAQYVGSLIGNLHVRLRYGNGRDLVGAAAVAVAAIARTQPFEGARRRIIIALLALARRAPAILFSRRISQATFPLRGLDYEFIRDGAFVELKKLTTGGPKVSIVTRTYQGRENFLRQAAASVFRQTYQNLEWVVVEDGGDTLRRVVDGLTTCAPYPVCYYPQAKVGRSQTGNAGLGKTSGELLMFLDDDDLLYADHVEVLVAALRAQNECVAAYALSFQIPTLVDSEGRLTETSYSTPGVFYQPFDYTTLCHHNYIPIQAILFKRELFEARGGFDIELDQLEDWNLWLRYAYRNRFCYVPKTTSLFRVPANPDVMAKRQVLLDNALETASRRAMEWRLKFDAQAQGGIRERNAAG